MVRECGLQRCKGWNTWILHDPSRGLPHLVSSNIRHRMGTCVFPHSCHESTCSAATSLPVFLFCPPKTEYRARRRSLPKNLHQFSIPFQATLWTWLTILSHFLFKLTALLPNKVCLLEPRVHDVLHCLFFIPASHFPFLLLLYLPQVGLLHEGKNS